MLGPLSLLPLQKGWEYKFRTWTKTLSRGQTLEVDRISTQGWLMNVIVVSNDAYGGVNLKFQGAELELHEFAFDAESGATIGAFAQDPSGWVQEYYRPDPDSTAGIFTTVFSMGFEGFPMPFVPTIISELYLTENSTQLSAIVRVSAISIEIINRDDFIKSLRAILGMPIVQQIDPALNILGPAEIKMVGPLEKVPS